MRQVLMVGFTPGELAVMAMILEAHMLSMNVANVEQIEGAIKVKGAVNGVFTQCLGLAESLNAKFILAISQIEAVKEIGKEVGADTIEDFVLTPESYLRIDDLVAIALRDD